jgi:hypothetical protein
MARSSPKPERRGLRLLKAAGRYGAGVHADGWFHAGDIGRMLSEVLCECLGWSRKDPTTAPSSMLDWAPFTLQIAGAGGGARYGAAMPQSNDTVPLRQTRSARQHLESLHSRLGTSLAPGDFERVVGVWALARRQSVCATGVDEQ